MCVCVMILSGSAALTLITGGHLFPARVLMSQANPCCGAQTHSRFLLWTGTTNPQSALRLQEEAETSICAHVHHHSQDAAVQKS